MPAIRSIVEEYAQKAAFLWTMRDAAVRSPHFRLHDLIELDERLEAHLDGLIVAGRVAIEVCLEGASEGGPGETFVAGLITSHFENDLALRTILIAAMESPALARAAASALSWAASEPFNGVAWWLCRARSASLRSIGLATLANNRAQLGTILDDSLQASEPILRARALRAIGELARHDLVSVARAALSDSDRNCRFFAAISASLMGDAIATKSLQSSVTDDSRDSTSACAIAVRTMTHKEARGWLEQLRTRPSTVRAAIEGAAALGDPAAVDWLAELLEVPVHARLAGEAIATIAGFDLTVPGMNARRPEGFISGPNADPDDDNVAMDPDERLPWPAPTALREAWKNHRAGFQNGVRYVLGQSLNIDSLKRALRMGNQPQRAGAALEIAILKRSAPFEVRMPAARQKRALASAAT